MSEPSTIQRRQINGLDVQQLFDTIGLIEDRPELGRFHFRARNRWVRGGHNRTTISGFYGAGQEHDLPTRPFILEEDEPPILLGGDRGPNPVEYLLTALAGCITTSMVVHAAAQGIVLESVQSELEGDIDLRGFMAIDESVPKGYQQIRVRFRLEADVPDEQLEELVRMGARYSPVFNTLTQGVEVSAELARD